MTQSQPKIDVKEITVGNLSRLETYTDDMAGTIFRKIPVLIDGSYDPMRMESFMGSCQILTAQGPIPINFPIAATSLAEALAQFPAAGTAAIQQLLDQSLRNKIIQPGGPTSPANKPRLITK